MQAHAHLKATLLKASSPAIDSRLEDLALQLVSGRENLTRGSLVQDASDGRISPNGKDWSDISGWAHPFCNASRRPAGKVERLVWRPVPGSFLLAMCAYGRGTNRLLCLRHYILAASLLNRTLIVPLEDLAAPTARWNAKGFDPPHRFDLLVDIGRINRCLAGGAAGGGQSRGSDNNNRRLLSARGERYLNGEMEGAKDAERGWLHGKEESRMRRGSRAGEGDGLGIHSGATRVRPLRAVEWDDRHVLLRGSGMGEESTRAGAGDNRTAGRQWKRRVLRGSPKGGGKAASSAEASAAAEPQSPAPPPLIITLGDFFKHFAGRQPAAATSLNVDRFLCWSANCGVGMNGLSIPPYIHLPPASLVTTPPGGKISLAGFASAMADVSGGKGGRVVCLGDLFYLHSMFSDLPRGFQQGMMAGWLGEEYDGVWGPGDTESSADASDEMGSERRSQPAGSGAGRGVGVALSPPPMPCGTVAECVRSGGACRALLWPHQAVVDAALGFVREVIGRPFVAVHLRRDDMFRSCVEGRNCPYWSQRQSAECVASKLFAADLLIAADRGRGADAQGDAGAGYSKGKERLPVLFLASDASDEDLRVFLSVLQRASRRAAYLPTLSPSSLENVTAMESDGSTEKGMLQEGPYKGELGQAGGITVVRLPSLAGKVWARTLNRIPPMKYLDRNKKKPMSLPWTEYSDVVATVEKVVCAQAKVFLGTPSSTFTDHIMTMREAIGNGNCVDGGICKGVSGAREW